MFECNSDDNKKYDKNDVEYSLDRVRLGTFEVGTSVLIKMAAPTVFIAVARDQNGNVIFPATAVTNDCNNNFDDLFRKAATVSSVEVRNSLVYIVPMVDTIPDVHKFGHPVQKVHFNIFTNSNIQNSIDNNHE